VEKTIERYLSEAGPEADWLLSGNVACYTLAVSFIDQRGFCKRGTLFKSFSCKPKCDHSFTGPVR